MSGRTSILKQRRPALLPTSNDEPRRKLPVRKRFFLPVLFVCAAVLWFWLHPSTPTAIIVKTDGAAAVSARIAVRVAASERDTSRDPVGNWWGHKRSCGDQEIATSAPHKKCCEATCEPYL